MGGPRSRPQPQDPQTSEFFRNRLSGETSEGVDKRQRRREPRRPKPEAQPEPSGSARALILPPSLGPLEQGLGPGTPALVSHWGRTVPGHMGSAGAEAARLMQAEQLQKLQALQRAAARASVRRKIPRRSQAWGTGYGVQGVSTSPSAGGAHCGRGLNLIGEQERGPCKAASLCRRVRQIRAPRNRSDASPLQAQRMPATNTDRLANAYLFLLSSSLKDATRKCTALDIMCACVHSRFSWAPLFATPRAVAHQAPVSMGFSRQEYWSGFPFPSPGDLPDPGTEPACPASAGGFFYHLSHLGRMSRL